ncbi:hypothetical protein ACFWWB_37865 [Streptomyces sp. NPDC058690]|uniref:hypothetical protein n=1 Tax=Streptomyces sp. NPDC058690 TaxID=3346600 RepID=UPI00365FEDA3
MTALTSLLQHSPSPQSGRRAPRLDLSQNVSSGANLKAVCKGPPPLPEEDYRKALDEEFNMPYPNDFRHNRHGELEEKLILERNDSFRYS